MGKVFYSRCRPQDSDPIDIVVRERRVFIGYPAFREGMTPQRGRLRDAIIDFHCSDAEWTEATHNYRDRKMYSQTRNFARSIQIGDIALVPRPSRGVVYAGRAVSRFEVLDDASWADDYLRLRNEQNLDVSDVFSHLGDILQCCEVDEFRAISFSAIPAWVRKSLFGRSTFGFVGSLPLLELDPYETLDDIIGSRRQVGRAWTTSSVEVERRLAASVGPSSFEHLCVALLQLEHPDEIWEHVGGSGDGGVDGVGAKAEDPGCVTGLLQCKFVHWGGRLSIAERDALPGTRQILASLLHPEQVDTAPDIEFWSRQTIAALVIKHSHSLPLATTLRVGEP